MQIAEFMELLLRLDRKHQDDRDGGYALAASIVHHLQQLSPEHREQALNVLLTILALGLVPESTDRLWGVSLEVVIKMMTAHLAQEILALSEIANAEQRAWLIEALLRSSAEYPESLWRSIVDKLAKSSPSRKLFSHYVSLYSRLPKDEFMERIASLFVPVFLLKRVSTCG